MYLVNALDAKIKLILGVKGISILGSEILTIGVAPAS